MPSIRKPLSITQKLIALYTDPHAYALADHVARDRFGTPPGHRDYRRNLTHFMVDMEARLHGDRQQTVRHLADREGWNQRREWALRATGSDILLPQAPTDGVVRKWRYRFVRAESQLDDDPEDRKNQQREIERTMAAFVAVYERLAMERARELGQFKPGRFKGRNLVNLRRRFVCSADGTYLRAFSQVEVTEDPETGGTMVLGSRAKKENGIAKNPRVQQAVHRDKKAGRDTMGVNHVAILTRTRYGRVILGIERALGGEVHGALRAMDRIAPLAAGDIWALAYDKALSGWQIDYLLAHHGIVSIAPPSSANGQIKEVQTAADVAEQILAANDSAATGSRPAAASGAAPEDQVHGAAADQPEAGARNRKPGQGHTKRIKTAVLTRVLGRTFNVEKLIADAEAGRPLGAGLKLGTSVYVNSHDHAVPVHSLHQKFLTRAHEVGSETCTHELYVDDGALWDTRLELGVRVKDQRLQCLSAEAVKSDLTGLHELKSTYQFVCEYTGEVLTQDVHFAPSGKWDVSVKTTARRSMMLLARCDSRWRKIYGLRNDCESWFAWLKQQMLDDKRAPSLDLNHQLLDVLYAAVLTNAIARFNYRREGHLKRPRRR